MQKTIMVATLVAIAALVGTPIMAEAITDLYGVRVSTDEDGNYNSIVFRTQAEVMTDGSVFGGYAIPTENGDFIAVTSHAGFFDSETQFEDSDFNLDPSNPIWHSHLMRVAENAVCSDVALVGITWESHSDEVIVREGSTNIWVKNIALGTTLNNNMVGANGEFTVGNPILIESDRPHSGEGPSREPGERADERAGEKQVKKPVSVNSAPRVNGLVESISFDWNVAPDGTICLGDIATFEEGPGNGPEPIPGQ